MFQFCSFAAKEQLSQFQLSLNNEQRKLCSEAAGASLSSNRLHQRLVIYKRYYIALNRAPYVSEFTNNIKQKSNESSEIKVSKRHKLTAFADPTIGLARVGSRAALNFSFAFLRRAWRLGKVSC